ncbi:His/Glu/Gln/Arg/opine family amino acid ABC transporter permease subunit [Hydrogenispora ethanolica]|uniref:His/Glu/Gln/Arg/opine family amino acid ABC transporter permease subunit n=2 Tax=Hydrogenispora ethanolica TaxID=1082276 RepID=A0A4R1RZJ1_HYDET|nr:His/Glu/Gln/Arg/opine family amino acid ABC transporter permease subunit [Hydrogenispora ethanolica]
MGKMFSVQYKIHLALILTALLAFGLSCPAFGAAKNEASLEISSDPAGATIYLDGKNTHQITPYTFHGLSVGEHHISVSKPPYYRSEAKQMTLDSGANVTDFSLPETSWYYMWLSLPNLLLGALMTLFLTIVAVFDGIIIGTFAGVARVIHNKVANMLAGIYVDFIRGTPLLVQIFMIHFGSPPLLGMLFNNGQPVPINPFISALVALSINSGAYVAEIVRAGIQSIDRGQMEAARSLGMSYRQAMRHIILPQALKRVIPPLGNEFIAMLKDSSLVSVIGMEELVRKAQVIVTRSYRPTETWFEVGIIFLIMTIPFTRIVAHLERRLKTGD